MYPEIVKGPVKIFQCLLNMNEMMVTPMNQLIIKGISSKFNILQMTGDKTIVIDKNDVT